MTWTWPRGSRQQRKKPLSERAVVCMQRPHTHLKSALGVDLNFETTPCWFAQYYGRQGRLPNE